MSIVVRTHAGRTSLATRALQSVVVQNYRPLEVIVVEDGSDDATILVEELRRASDLSVEYATLPKVGRAVAGNLGLEMSSGKWINFLDDDDELLPHHVQTLVGRLASHGVHRAAYARSLMVPTTVHSLEPLYLREHGQWLFHGRPFSRWLLWRENQFPIQACLFDRSLYELHGGFDPSLPLLEDWELWVRYLSAEKVLFVNEVTSFFRIPGEALDIRAREREIARYANRVRSSVGVITVEVSVGELPAALEETTSVAFRESPVLRRIWTLRVRLGCLARPFLCLIRKLAERLVRSGRRGRAVSFDPELTDTPLRLTISEAIWLRDALLVKTYSGRGSLIIVKEAASRSTVGRLARQLVAHRMHRRLRPPPRAATEAESVVDGPIPNVLQACELPENPMPQGLCLYGWAPGGETDQESRPP